jgi:phosphoesterase RecJ-like protein
MKNILDSADVAHLRTLIEKSKHIVITCHVRPDGDAIGSSLSLLHLLRDLGKDASVVIPDRVPRSLLFLPGVKDIAVFTQHEPYCRRLVAEADLIIMCDFNTASRQGNLSPVIQEATAAKILIDHHQNPDLKAEVIFSDPTMSSTCELLFRIIAALGLYSNMSKQSATALLTGLITDTQNFTVNCNSSDIYDILIRLLDKGVDKKHIIDEAVKSCTLDSLRLNAFAIANRLEVFEKERCSLITLSKEDLDKFNYQKGDTEGLVNEPLNIRGIVYSVFMREDPDCIKVSTRSKHNFPVSQICSDLFNGGGHIMAAGGEFYGTLEECKKLFIENMDKYNKYLPQRLDKLEI